ncbi:hypothetical protein YTPLAS18_00560 [Nitrospira sp.]|nr:hypothetical protein YTPLAS18_00560 [Nitrospira sp.]
MLGIGVAMLAMWMFPALLRADTFEDLKKGVVKITAKAEGQQPKVGTGFIVSAEEGAAYIVTAAHVIGGDPQPEVEFFTKAHQTFKAKVIASEGGRDNGLAALLVQMKMPQGTVALGLDKTTQLSGGETVSSIGFPRRREAWAVTTGSISGIKNRQITVQAPIEEGNSGGPLLLNGRVVGVITQSTGSFGQAEPTLALQLLLHSWRVPVTEERSSHVRTSETAEDRELHNIEDELAGREKRGTPRVASKAAINVTGTWMVPGEPGFQYVFKQHGRQVTMTQTFTNPALGSEPRVYAEGEIDGRHLEMVYINASGMGSIELDVQDDRTTMQGVFNLGLVPLNIKLVKQSE